MDSSGLVGVTVTAVAAVTASDGYDGRIFVSPPQAGRDANQSFSICRLWNDQRQSSVSIPLENTHGVAVTLLQSDGNIVIFMVLLIESKPVASQPAVNACCTCMPDALLIRCTTQSRFEWPSAEHC